jgi:hypothetical protein
MQRVPLLEKSDWVFTSSSWALSYPDTSVQMLSRPLCDHSPYVISISTFVPKSKLFRFENFWMDFPDFLSMVYLHWNTSPYFATVAQSINAKSRQVRAGVKFWSKELSKFGKLINNCNFVLALLDGLEEQRILNLLESSFRRLVKKRLKNLLEAREYCKMGKVWG